MRWRSGGSGWWLARTGVAVEGDVEVHNEGSQVQRVADKRGQEGAVEQEGQQDVLHIDAQWGTWCMRGEIGTQEAGATGNTGAGRGDELRTCTT